jgi:hypothetical protein
MPDDSNPLWSKASGRRLTVSRTHNLVPRNAHLQPQALTPQVRPPEHFDLVVIQRDLEQLSSSSSLVMQYVTAARAKYRGVKQIELIGLLTNAVRKKTALINAQVSLAEAEERRMDFFILQDLRRQLKKAELQAQLAEVNLRKSRAERDLASHQQGSVQGQIREQQAHIDQLEKERAEELAILSNGKPFEALSSAQQDRYMEADSSWDEKIKAECESLRALKQRRRQAT